MIRLIVKATIVVFLLFLLFWSRRKEAKRGKRIFDLATSLADSNKHEDACFHYALAANAGYERRLCRVKIRELWSLHGPFDFSEHLETLKSDYLRDHHCESVVTGLHHLTVRDIHKWVGETATEKKP